MEALHLRDPGRVPVWIMRQAGRYLPEYRALREHHSFSEAVSTPEVAAEITVQPLRRFDLDGAVIFADIMTPLQAMGIEITFDPGPRLRPMTLAEVAALGELDVDRVAFVGETIRRVRKTVADEVAIIGFAGGPVTLLAYLLEGGGSRDFLTLRRAVAEDPGLVGVALGRLAAAMNAYLAVQVEAGADVVQLFDTWAGVVSRARYAELVLPSARSALEGLRSPTIYFAPGAGHTLDLQAGIGASGYGIDWRLPVDEAWHMIGQKHAIQGNVDPAVLLTNPTTISSEVAAVLDRVEGRRGHVLNLGHGIDRRTPVENVSAFVEAARR